MSAETKTIFVEVVIPVSIELRVRWDEDDESAAIESVAFSHIQQSLTPRRLEEHMSEGDFQEIDKMTMKAFGVET